MSVKSKIDFNNHAILNNDENKKNHLNDVNKSVNRNMNTGVNASMNTSVNTCVNNIDLNTTANETIAVNTVNTNVNSNDSNCASNDLTLVETTNLNENDKMLPLVNRARTLSEIYREMEITDDIRCGFGCVQGDWLQRFANKNIYVFVFGLFGCLFSASYAYSTATITMIEKRFRIPSRTTGIISVGNDISTVLVSSVLSYYAGRGNRPRWIAFGLFLIATFCLMSALPQLLYGSGENALMLTREHSLYNQINSSTSDVIQMEQRKKLCQLNEAAVETCEMENGSFAPEVILFVAQFISGIGGCLYHTLGVSYMDDNIKKSKTPALISLSYFIRLLGPAMGYSLASVCLKLYISPYLTPTIDQSDPRWLGAWWLGWIVLSIPIYLCTFIMAMFPKTLPKSAARKLHATLERLSAPGAVENNSEKKLLEINETHLDGEEKASIRDMFVTFKRIFSNVTLMLNNLASIFYFIGFMPYWIFMPKYIETQYRQTASVASFATGMIGLLFSALGILVSGIVITLFKPSARYLAAWNVFVGIVDIIGISTYAFLGCEANEANLPLLPNGELYLERSCNINCNCDYVKYSPVCSENGLNTFISACHAGCKDSFIFPNGSVIFTNCACIAASSASADKWISANLTTLAPTLSAAIGGSANPGACPVDCTSIFHTFLIVVCLIKFTGASGRASNFLISVRCVSEKDKPAALGFGLMIMSLFAFIPSPILFGMLLDKTCLVWGKTCTGTGNCWLYDSKSLRYVMNFTSVVFVTIGTLIDCGVWYCVKNLKIFDDEPPTKTKEIELKIVQNESN